jgi:hypothetical protein
MNSKKQIKMRHLIEFDSYLNETAEEYDHILDLYNKGGLKKMWSEEIDSFKSGGKEGGAFRHHLPDEIAEIYDDVMEYLDSKHIKYTLEDTYSIGVGMIRYIDLPYTDEVFNKLESMFPENKSIIPFVQKRPNGRCFVYVLNPKDYKDFIEARS